jgi:pyruvate,water dikinase
MMSDSTDYIRWFSDLGNDDVGEVGGKNASLGEMISTLKDQGVRVPDGFATTAAAYRAFIEANELGSSIRERLGTLDGEEETLAKAGKAIRRLFERSAFPEDLEEQIRNAYTKLSQQDDVEEIDVAARSSATAEDLPHASFAGQQESFLNVSGEDDLLEACKRCYASLFTDRAISYREQQGFDHMKVALSVGVQKMVRADSGGAGVIFTIDTETGFPDVLIINAAWGLGENVVQGTVKPDEYRVFKPLLETTGVRPVISRRCGEKEMTMVYARGGSDRTRNVETKSKDRRRLVLDDDQVLQLARWSVAIERHYERPMDIEWALDGETDELFIVQARPETVQSQRQAETLHTYELNEHGEVLLEGLAIGAAIGAGSVCVLDSIDDADDFSDGGVLVTEMTDPDWVPIMKRASAIVTELGGRTSHAAIVSRELGVPAIVGAEDAMSTLKDGREVTVSCTEGATGRVYDGRLDYDQRHFDLEDMPETRTRVMMNLASPDGAFRWWKLPAEGIGLARMEFIINNVIKIHPMALVDLDAVKPRETRREIRRLTRRYDDKAEYFVDHLAQGIASIAAPQYPDPVIVRLSDFKTNEYADLIGGESFEPDEENPMLGFRGASRYYSDRYRAGFALECRALKRVRDDIGLDNVIVMVPFCRTLEEADRVLGEMSANGLTRGERGLQVYVMAEIPSNIILADAFAERFDGFSIGSNDLTQLVLGVDRDSADLAHVFDERNEAVRRSIRDLIETAHAAGRTVGICGQAPSDHPDFAAFLVECGIDSISLTPDRVVETKYLVADAEATAGVTS